MTSTLSRARNDSVIVRAVRRGINALAHSHTHLLTCSLADLLPTYLAIFVKASLPRVSRWWIWELCSMRRRRVRNARNLIGLGTRSVTATERGSDAARGRKRWENV